MPSPLDWSRLQLSNQWKPDNRPFALHIFGCELDYVATPCRSLAQGVSLLWHNSLQTFLNQAPAYSPYSSTITKRSTEFADK